MGKRAHANPSAWRLAIGLAALAGLLAPESAWAASTLWLRAGSVVGAFHSYELQRGDNAAWVAVKFGVHPVRVAPLWEAGRRLWGGLRVDTRRVLPTFDPDVQGIVLNVPEAQVYLVKGGDIIRDYPVAVSAPDKPVPIGLTKVVSKEKNPTWFIPESIQKEMAERGLEVKKEVAPGPRNPLGPRWIGFWNGSFGMHGTNVPTSIKKYASHGCVRFRAADIKDLYDRVWIGTPIRVVYQPVMLGVDSETVWLSVFPDIYKQHFDYRRAVKALAGDAGVLDELNWRAVDRAIARHDGVIANVGRGEALEPLTQVLARPKPPASVKRPVRVAPSPPPTPTPLPELEETGNGDLPPEQPPDPWFTSP